MAGAIRKAAETRFRPILLTSITTFIGLLPMKVERSLQAQFSDPDGGVAGLRRAVRDRPDAHSRAVDPPDRRGHHDDAPFWAT